MIKPLRLLKKLPFEIQKHITEKENAFTRFNIFVQDESRFGLFTRVAKMITARGIQPISPYQHRFENTYLFGAFSPINGDSLLLELPYCNADTFQYFLDELSGQKPDELKIVILDNGAFHKAKSLQVPANICLIFLPPYSPELNPAELVWKYIKSHICNKVFKNLDELSDELMQIITNRLTTEKIKSITGFKLYSDLFMTILEL